MTSSSSQLSVVLGISGGIAAYKMAEVASRLTQEGADVQTILTENAQRFVTPLTFAALTLNPVHTSLWNNDLSQENGVAASMAHIALARDADVILVAPASADIIAKLAHGICDDLLTTVVLATKAPVIIAPAMNPEMYAHAATQKNLQQLKEFGYHIIDPESGRTACDEYGAGRLPAPEVLLNNLRQYVDAKSTKLKGKKILVTAGPTREAIDPVRFISNRSSGKMGYAVAGAAHNAGAEVLLVSGPVSVQPPRGVKVLSVTTAQQMHRAVLENSAHQDVIIGVAAPADFMIETPASQKIKKENSDSLHLELIQTPDIIASVTKNKKPGQIIIGFAAETNNTVDNANNKLKNKNLDAIILNDVSQPEIGFDSDNNQVHWITENENETWPLSSKKEIGKKIVEKIVELIN